MRLYDFFWHWSRGNRALWWLESYDWEIAYTNKYEGKTSVMIHRKQYLLQGVSGLLSHFNKFFSLTYLPYLFESSTVHFLHSQRHHLSSDSISVHLIVSLKSQVIPISPNASKVRWEWEVKLTWELTSPFESRAQRGFDLVCISFALVFSRMSSHRIPQLGRRVLLIMSTASTT